MDFIELQSSAGNTVLVNLNSISMISVTTNKVWIIGDAIPIELSRQSTQALSTLIRNKRINRG